MLIINTTALSSLHLTPTDTVQSGAAFIERSRFRTKGSSGNQPDYLQRVQLSDKLLLQVHTTADEVRLYVYDEDGTMVKDVPFSGLATPAVTYTGRVTVSGNTARGISGNVVQLETFSMLFSFAGLGLDEGVYTVVVRLRGEPVSGNYTATRHLISEPVWVKPKWPGSVLISYRHRVNNDDFVWEPFPGVAGSIRIGGSVSDLELSGEEQIYDDGNYRPVLLSSHPQTIYELATVPLPPFLRRKLAHIFGCSAVAIDGRRVVKAGTITTSEGGQMRTFALPFKTQDAAVEWISGNKSGQVLLMATLYPFVFSALRMGANTYAAPVLVEGPQDLERVVSALGGSASTTLAGEFEDNGGVLSYNTNGIEALTEEMKADILPLFVEVQSTAVGISVTASYDGQTLAVQPAITRKMVIAEPIAPGTIGTLKTYTFAPTTITPALPSGYRTDTRIFFDSTSQNINITSAGATEVRGRIAGLRSLNVNMSNLGVFDLYNFPDALPSLELLRVRGYAPNDGGVTKILGLNQPWAKLSSINCSLCALSVADVDQVIKDVAAYAVAQNKTGGGLLLNGQTPAAPPSGSPSVNAALANLSGLGWTVITD